MNYPFICIICYIVVFFIKKTKIKNEFLPLISCALGIVLSIIGFYVLPQYMLTENVLVAIIGGAMTGLAATGGNQVFKQALKYFADKYSVKLPKINNDKESKE